MLSADSLGFRNSVRVALLVVAGILANAGTATAGPWHVGDFITHDQGEWGNDPDPGTAAALLRNQFNTAFASTGGSLEVGLPGASGYSILFTDPEYILDELPMAGAQMPLNQDYVNPTVGIPNIVAGDVVALQLDIGYSDAGLLAGTSGLRFGDLILTNFSTATVLPDGSTVSAANLNGLTVRQFLAVVNTALGGGPPIDSIGDLDDITAYLNVSFEDGTFVSPFAQDHLVAPPSVASVPEPSSWVLLGTGLLGLAAARRQQRRR